MSLRDERREVSFVEKKGRKSQKNFSLPLSLSLFLFFLTKRKIRDEVEGVLVAGRLLVLLDERRRGGEGVVRLSDGVAFRFFQIFSFFFEVLFFSGELFFYLRVLHAPRSISSRAQQNRA